MRRITAFTGTRAEYGLLRPVLRLLRAAPDIELHLLVSGSHLEARYGETIREIRAEGFSKITEIPVLPSAGANAVTLCSAMGGGMASYAHALQSSNPDLLLVLGDRYETFFIATAAILLAIPIAHIHGGEVTVGAMDDAFRHAITKMSHLHFASAEANRRRIIQMGEQPHHVWTVGSLGVENALTLPLPDETCLRERLEVGDHPYLLATFHPVTLEPGKEVIQLSELLAALSLFPDHIVVFTAANADPGGDLINAMLKEQARNHADQFRFFSSLGVEGYLAAAKYAACVIGNSSSGILEIPSLCTPVVDVGQRQAGRLRSAAVLHCIPQTADIHVALLHALTPQHAAFCRIQPNPYEKTGTAHSITHILRTHSLHGILHKIFYDLPVDPIV